MCVFHSKTSSTSLGSVSNLNLGFLYSIAAPFFPLPLDAARAALYAGAGALEERELLLEERCLQHQEGGAVERRCCDERERKRGVKFVSR